MNWKRIKKPKKNRCFICRVKRLKTIEFKYINFYKMQYIDKGFVQVIYYGLNYDLKRISNTFVFICSQYELQ